MTASNILTIESIPAQEAAGNYRNLIFSEKDDRRRLREQYVAIRPMVVQQFERILDEFGLAQRLQEAAGLSGQRTVGILDFGCNEGWYLHDFARLLEQRGLSEVAELIGIDNNPAAISAAQEYTKISSPNSSYFHFYNHDGRNPLQECAALGFHPSCSGQTELGADQEASSPVQFDFVFALLVMEHISEVQPVLERLYNQNLKPGGVIYLFETEIERSHQLLSTGELHPTLHYVISRVLEMIALNNRGANISQEQAGWLFNLGAEQVTTYLDTLDVGGHSQAGIAMLQVLVMATQNMGPGLVKKGLLSQAEFDKMLDRLYAELTPQVQGQLAFVHTLARKPS